MNGREHAAIDAVVVIPALNPTETLLRLVSEILSTVSSRVVVVDDGSGEGCAPLFEALEAMGCDVITHGRNLGKGTALKDGISRALIAYPDTPGVVTADADGQHTVQDISRLAECLIEGVDGIVLGTRALDGKQVPFKNRLGNKAASLVFRLKTGIRLCDTQTGLRAIPMRYAPAVLQAQGSRFEYEMNMLLYADRMGIPLVTLPIAIVYPDSGRVSYFRTVRDSARIYWGVLTFGRSRLKRAGGRP